MSFLTEFFNINEESGETAVCCPFPHLTSGGMSYFETNPSAHCNTTSKLYHCKVCGTGYSETQFIQQLLGCGVADAKKIQHCFETTEDLHDWNDSTILTPDSKSRAMSLGISEEVITELNLRTPAGSGDLIAFPVFMFDHLIDIRKYDPGNKPKVMSRSKSPMGMIIPFDKWRESAFNRTTLICAGEKDMAIARTYGFNAITITGGEASLPKALKYFKDRKVVIAYDNDGAGILGAKKLAATLKPYTSTVKVLTKFHEVCSNRGEDITDFFMKYRKTKEDLIKFMEETDDYIPTPDDLKRNYPIIDLLTASRPENLNKIVRSNIQIVAVSEATYTIPSVIMAEKFKVSGDDYMAVGETREWELNEETCQDLLHLMDNNFTEEIIAKNTRNIMKIMLKEKYVNIKTLEKKTIFKAYVTDMFETSATDTQPMEYTAYSIAHKLESGKKYMATYKLVPHPYKGQQLTMIVLDIVQANDSVSNFQITTLIKEHLKTFQDITGTVNQRMNTITEKAKGLIGYNGNNQLIQTIDLAFHTVLQFKFGTFKQVRGYLDTIIVGESRTGKSSTADILRSTYALGTFTSLAGNSATIAGLVGGSNKTSSGYQTRAGTIPQNHKGLIIFEEFGKSNANVTKELTDIRSSNEVRISRVSGTITLPAMVRMIALTNTKSTGGMLKPIASYPNGIIILTELIGTAEDIARYDIALVSADRGNSQIDPLWEAPEPFTTEEYQARIRWVWSRTPDQIVISKELSKYIMDTANALNTEYACHIKVFGTEAWKKLTRLALAVAGYLVSTDATYEHLILEQDHVDFARNYLISIYDNPTFKLREYAEHERKYSTIDADGISALQDIYQKSPGLILQLEQCATASRNMLAAATGLDQNELNNALTSLTKGLFVQFSNHEIIPTERFRLGLSKINRKTTPKKLGELQ
jgi:DNA primase